MKLWEPKERRSIKKKATDKVVKWNGDDKEKREKAMEEKLRRFFGWAIRVSKGPVAVGGIGKGGWDCVEEQIKALILWDLLEVI